ncbi:MAG: (d)CMP kinase [Clostridiales bacterium]|nr:(d)CMP kinase [Clostridiales bacterium]
MINIAIDGPCGSGKSTVAKLLAKELNILYLDTGAMYRACGLKAKRMGIDCLDEKGVSSFIYNIDLKVKYENGTQHVYLDGEDVSLAIRENEVSMLASNISSLEIVRKKMVEMQRYVASMQDCVLDGRDICMYVLPNANYKFFMTASAEVRAKRRYEELISRGQTVDYNSLLVEINQRDYNDSHRECAPLAIAPDAEVIDTSNMSIQEVVAHIVNKVRKGEE